MARLFNLEDTLIIDSKWVLRNDQDYIVLYIIDNAEAKTWVLPPLLSYAIVLINGSNTYRQLISKVGRVFGIDDFKGSKLYLDRILKLLRKNEVGVKVKSSSDNWNVFESSEFFIPIETYHFPKRFRLRYPTKVTLYTTKKCCAECIYCYADRREDNPDQVLSLSEWRRIIDECIHLGIWNIDLIGGDQLSTQKNLKIMKYLMSRNISLFISTKCEVTESVAEKLVSCGFFDKPRGSPHKLQLSIDSIIPKLADFMTGTSNFLQRIERSVDNCIKHNIIPKIKTVLTPLNFREIRDIICLFSEKGIQEFQFVYYGLSFPKPREDLLLSEEQKKWIHETYPRIIKDYPKLRIVVQDEYNPNQVSFKEKMAAWRIRARCTGGFSAITILPTGKFVICEQIPQTEQYILGDVREDGLMGVWCGSRIEEFLFRPKEAFQGMLCEKCKEFDDCQYNAGFCYKDALFAYDTMFEASPKCPYQTKLGRRLY